MATVHAVVPQWAVPWCIALCRRRVAPRSCPGQRISHGEPIHGTRSTTTGVPRFSRGREARRRAHNLHRMLTTITAAVWRAQVSLLLAAFLVGCTVAAPTPTAVAACNVTSPNGLTPPARPADPQGYGNGRLWTSLWTNGVVIFKAGGPGAMNDDGSLEMKWPWDRGDGVGQLVITGRRLDAPGPPLRSSVNQSYGDTGFQPSTLIFPSPGCWEVTGTVGSAALTFVTSVIRE